MTIHIKDGDFVDEHGRILNLRGINLGGSSKIPTNKTTSENWFDSKTATFVNRPFSIVDAPLHFKRIRACGFTLIRFIITWEAIEREAPGVYDYEYINYVKSILEIANEHDIQVYIDPHQDVWSRWTGGDGAPLWTLEKVGFNVSNFRITEAAITEQTYGTGHSTAEQRRKKKGFPKMIWPTNYFKLASATMFTLFWAGERFAHNFMVDNDSNGSKVNIQTYLQRHYINAMVELLKHLNGLDNIIGIGTMNEPSSGYCNVADLSKGFGQSGASSSGAGSKELKYGLAPTPFQGMCLGEGYKQTVGDYSNGIMQHVFGKPDYYVLVDPKGKKAWKDDSNGCIWKQSGVWRTNPQTSEPELIFPRYFANVDFGTECYLPFAKEYTDAMRAMWKGNQLLMFVELPPLEFSSTPFPTISSKSLPDAVNATHWYDGVTLFTQTWRAHFSVDTHTHKPVIGYNNIFKMHVNQLGDIKQLGIEKMDKSPTLIGECGIPYDMIESRTPYDMIKSTARKLRGSSTAVNFRDTSSSQLQAMNHTLCCLEKNLLSFTLWNYTPDHSNKEGDIWNGENLSIYSEDEKCGLNKTDPFYIYDGLRAARAFVRPYAQCIAGIPLVNEFDMNKRKYTLVCKENDGSKHYDVPTSEIFVPKLWCLKEADMKIHVSDGTHEVKEHDDWFIVYVTHLLCPRRHRVEIKFT